jgi:hypothetical protein
MSNTVEISLKEFHLSSQGMYLAHPDSADRLSFFKLHPLELPLVSLGCPLSFFKYGRRRNLHLRLCLERIPILAKTKKLIHSSKVASGQALKGLEN